MYKAKHLVTGEKGEDISVKYLEKEGFKILERNFRKPWGEIDIVALKDGIIHFVEVKTLSNVTRENDYEAEEKVDKKKRERLRRIIETYLESEVEEDKDYEIDVLAIYLDKDQRVKKINFLKDVIL